MRELGGGRLTKETVLQPDVGVDGLAKPGDRIEAGSLLCRVHARTQEEARQAAHRLGGAFSVADEPPMLEPLILERL